MKVLHLHAGNLYGGTERVVETLARERARCAALDPMFALCFDGKLAGRLREMDVPVELLGPARFSRPDLVFQVRRRLTALLCRRTFDVVVTQSVWSHALFAPIVRRMELPLVLWIHDLLNGHHWVEKLARRWQPDLLICNSRNTEAAARAVFPDVPAEVIHGPISFDRTNGLFGQPARAFGGNGRNNPGYGSHVDVPSPVNYPGQGYGSPPRPPAKAKVGHDPRHASESVKTGQNGSKVVIVHVGRMVALKGHSAVIDALALLPAEPAWTCWFVGGAQTTEEEAYTTSLRGKVAQLGLTDRVRFLGASDDVMSILRQADIYCQPNEQPEAFGLTLVEAMQAGLPIIATDFGGAREIITDACGRLVPPHDGERLAAMLRWMVEDARSRKTFGRNGPARAWMLCNPDARLHQLQVALERIRARSGRESELRAVTV